MSDRIFIQVGNGRVECLPGTRLVDLYRSDSPAPACKSAEESNAKTAEAKQRIFKMSPTKKYEHRRA